MLLQDHESAQLYYAVQSVFRVFGDLAEVGCYRGATASSGQRFFFCLWPTLQGRS